MDENIPLNKIPNAEKVKRVVFALNPDSACGPDGLIGYFYQSC